MSEVLNVLLAPSQNLTDKDLPYLTYPVYVSGKFDGCRLHVQGNQVRSRTNKPFPNKRLQEELGAYDCLDGEVVCGSPTMDGGFNYTQSIVMSQDKQLPEDWVIYVFDLMGIEGTYKQRLDGLSTLVLHPNMIIVEQHLCLTPASVLVWEAAYRKSGFEGVMVRSVDGPYTEGRCSFSSQTLLKFKRFEDSEGLITGINQGYKDNPQKALPGQPKIVKSFLCGGFKIWDGKFKWNCEVAPGKLTHEQSAHILANPDLYIGKTIKYKFQLKGEMTQPRFPTFQGFRQENE